MIENQKARIGQSVKFQAELPSEETQIEWFVGEFKRLLFQPYSLHLTTDTYNYRYIYNFIETTEISILNKSDTVII